MCVAPRVRRACVPAPRGATLATRMRRMPPTRDDRRLLVFTGVFVAIAAVLFAAAILYATGGQPEAKDGPIYIGPETVKKKGIRDEGPQYVINPIGHRPGFWLDL